MTTDIIPVRIDALPCPINAANEAQTGYATMKTLAEDTIIPRLNAEIQAMVQTGAPTPDFYKMMKEYKDVMKIMLDYLKVVKELTSDIQTGYQQMVADLLVQIAREDPELREKLRDNAVERARSYLKETRDGVRS